MNISFAKTERELLAGLKTCTRRRSLGHDSAQGDRLQIKSCPALGTDQRQSGQAGQVRCAGVRYERASTPAAAKNTKKAPQPRLSSSLVRKTETVPFLAK